MFERAEREFDAALKLQPKLAAAAVSLGLAMAQQGRLDEAIVQVPACAGN
jgi:Flp pilus assembly protein TadD